MTVVEYTFESHTAEMDTDKYFKDKNDIIEYLSKNKIKYYPSHNTTSHLDLDEDNSIKQFIKTIEENIANNKTPTFILFIQIFSCEKKIKDLVERKKKSRDDPISEESLITPSDYKASVDRTVSQYEELKSIQKDTEQKSFECLKNNWTEIKEHLLTIKERKAEQYKLKLKIAKAKYYQKKKEELGIQPKPTLTAEEKAEPYKEQVSKASKKYYEKKKEELLELGVMKPKQTEEEKKLARKEANKRYYENKKLKELVVLFVPVLFQVLLVVLFVLFET